MTTATPSTSPSMIDAALTYVARGWRVFPLHEIRDRGTQCSCGRRNCDSPGKHPRTSRGCLDASDDPAKVREWWRRDSTAGVAVATGHGLLVIDVDEGGDDTLHDLAGELGPLPDTVECLTGGGGRHLYFKVDPALPLKNSVRQLGPGVDVRTDGGYVVAAPSRHSTGRRYAWEASGDPSEVPVAPLPAAWVERLIRPPKFVALPGRGEPIASGSRNDTLFRLGRSLWGKNLSAATVLAALRAENDARCAPPLDDEEVAKIAASVCTVPPGLSPAYAARARPAGPQPGGAPATVDATAAPEPCGADSKTDGALDGLAERIRSLEQPSLAFAPSVLDTALDEEEDAEAFVVLRGALKDAGVEIKRWDAALSKRRKARAEEAKRESEARRQQQAADEREAHQRAVDEARAERAARGEPLPEDPNSAWAEDELTDLGNSERLVREHGSDFRYCAKQKAFYCWDGTRWRREDDDGAVMRFAKATIGALAHVANDPPSTKWATKSQGVAHLAAMVRLAKSNASVAIEPSEFDADPWAFNCTNGTIDLRTGALRPHRRGDFITKRSPVAYDPSLDPATCAPRFRRFMEEVQPDPEVRAYILRHHGYCLTGVIREHVIVFHHGGGRNGKGTLIAIVLYVMAGYATTIPAETLMAKKFDAHPVDKMKLLGVRFAVASEPEEGRALDTAAVKKLTGGDTVTARGMGENFVEWEPTHKIAVLCNPKPVVHETHRAIWDRMNLAPWGVTFEPHQIDPELNAKLKAEAPGVLRILVEACLAWQCMGLSPPAAVRAATQELRVESDEVGEFLGDQCVIDQGRGAKTFAKELYQAYAIWCEREGERPLSQKVFGAKVLADTARGITRSKYGGVKVYWGVRLRTDEESSAVPGTEWDGLQHGPHGDNESARPMPRSDTNGFDGEDGDDRDDASPRDGFMVEGFSS